jgi:hypothetical protein
VVASINMGFMVCLLAEDLDLEGASRGTRGETYSDTVSLSNPSLKQIN